MDMGFVFFVAFCAPVLAVLTLIFGYAAIASKLSRKVNDSRWQFYLALFFSLLTVIAYAFLSHTEHRLHIMFGGG